MENNIDTLIKNLKIEKEKWKNKIYGVGETRVDLMLDDVIRAISNVLSELEKYKNVTYFEKLEDGKLYEIDKERADDLYEHGNGNFLYIQMWKRKEG